MRFSARLSISQLRLAFGLLFVFLSFQTAANQLCILPPDTIRIEKEIIVYDTIYTYDYIYDTVYVFDTIFVDILNRLPTASLSNHIKTIRSLEGVFLRNDTILHNKIKESALFAEIATSAFIYQNFYSFPAATGAGFRRDFKVSLSPQPGFTLDARLGYMKSDRWLFKAGIAWSVFHEDFSYQLQARHFDNERPLANHKSIQNQQAKNKWTYLGIPLIAAKRMYFGAFELDLEGGLMPSFLLSSTRMLLFPGQNGPEGRIQTRDQTARFALNAGIGANLSYPLNSHWQIILNPWLNVPLLSTKNQGVAKSSNLAEGIRMGLRYLF